MSSINLLPDNIKEEIKASKTNKGIFSIFLSVLILGTVFFGFSFYGYQFLKGKLGAINIKIAKEEEKVKAFGTIEKDANNLKGRLDTVKSLNKDKVYWSKAVEEIAANVPGNMYLMNIKSSNEEKSRGRIMGNAGDKVAIASFIASLKDTGMFSYIDTESVVLMEDPFVKGRETNNFTITFTIDLAKLK